MSKTRHWWYYSVVTAIRQYPALAEKKRELQKTSITPPYEAVIKGSEIGRTTETAALRQLPQAEELWVDAIQQATEEVKRHRDGNDVLRIVKMVDYDRTHSVEGAAQVLHMDRATAWRRRSRFVYLVAKYAHYLPETEKLQHKSQENGIK